MLDRRGLQGVDSRYPEIDARGGLYIVPCDGRANEIRDEVLAHDIRALEVQAPDLRFLEGLPVEYLFLNTPRPEISPVNGLPELRSLAIDAWTGELDLAALPRLRWLMVTEPETDQLDGLLAQGHPGLDHLAVGRWRRPDLHGLGTCPGLSHLDLGSSRSLVSLDGAEQLPRLRVLELYRCPGLVDVTGLEGSRLEHVGIATCNKIADLAPLGSLRHLRSIQIELPRPPSLEPLLGVRGLEFAWLIGGKRPPAEIAALRELPSMRLVQSSRETWLRADDGWEHIGDIYAMTDEQQAAYARLHVALNGIKSW